MITTARSILVSAALLALPSACTPSGSSPSASASTSTSTTPPPPPPPPPHSAAPQTGVPEPETDPGETAADDKGAGGTKTVPDIEYVPTPANVVEKMLEASKIGKDDVLYDLGCGDGRIVVTAAKKLGVKAKGFDIDPVRVAESRENVKKAKVEHLVTIEQKDIFEVDLSPATVVTLYLLPELNVRLIPQLEKLKPGSRVVSHDFDMAGVEPEKWWTVMAPDHRDAKKTREHYVYLWKTPLKKVTAKK